MHIAETDLFRGSRQNVAALDPSMALGETSPLQGPEQLFNIGIGETLAPRNLGALRGSPAGTEANCRMQRRPYSSWAVILIGGISLQPRLPKPYFFVKYRCLGPWSEGMMAGDEVTCPWLGSRFNVKTGVVFTSSARQGMKSFPVRVVRNDVDVDIE